MWWLTGKHTRSSGKITYYALSWLAIAPRGHQIIRSPFRGLDAFFLEQVPRPNVGRNCPVHRQLLHQRGGLTNVLFACANKSHFSRSKIGMLHHSVSLACPFAVYCFKILELVAAHNWPSISFPPSLHFSTSSSFQLFLHKPNVLP